MLRETALKASFMCIVSGNRLFDMTVNVVRQVSLVTSEIFLRRSLFHHMTTDQVSVMYYSYPPPNKATLFAKKLWPH